MTIVERMKEKHQQYIAENFPNVHFYPARFSKKRWAVISKTKCMVTRFEIITEQNEEGEIESWYKV